MSPGPEGPPGQPDADRALAPALRAILADRGALAGRLTLLALLLAPIGFWLIRPSVGVLAAAGLLLPALARRTAFWLVLAALAALRVVWDWPLSDNHAYLLALWCLALGLACGAAAPGPVLASSARWLVGLTFALATLQKAVISPDYLDDTFFRWALAVDERFEDLGLLLGRDAEALERTRALLEAEPGETPDETAAFVETPALRAAATAMTWATLLAEGAVALVFLAPARLRVAWLRDAALLVFCVGTYAVAPVAGFGWLLLAMGVAQGRGPRALAGYLAAFALLLFYREIPWVRLLL